MQGIGWAVKPEGELDLPPSGVPYVKRELNWVRVAQRFPVRIEVENPDQDLFRMGASAVAIIKGPLDQMNSHALAVSSWLFAFPRGGQGRGLR